LRAETANFDAKNGDETSGTPEFYASDTVRSGRELGTWINVINKELTLAPGEKGGIYFDIKVPADAGPGSYFGAVIVTSSVPKSAPGVGVVGNTAILILLKVNGDAKEEAGLTSFTTIPRLLANLPAEFEARVENRGTVHLRPFGDIKIKNIFGQIVAVVPINRLEYKSVLPGGARRYAAKWYREKLPGDASILKRQLNNFALGPYTAELSMEYGIRKELLTAKSRFWVFPWLLILAVTSALVILITSIITALRWYRKRVIAQFERSKK
jgi:hypothetical protein